MLSTIKYLLSGGKPPKYYLSLCCIIRDENDYVEEWIRYHLKIGVEHFYIYDNGSEIPVRNVIEKAGLNEFTTISEISGGGKQAKAYRHCIKRNKYASRWIGFIDMDEYIVPKSTKGDMQKFLKDYEPYGGLGVNWLIFGSNGHIEKPLKPQIESYTLRSENDFPPNRHIKSIVQPRRIKNIKMATVHHFTYKAPFYCVDENFDHLDSPILAKNSTGKIQLNHYYCRSLREYQNKIARGYGDKKETRTIEEFHYHDKSSNAVRDTSILEVLHHLESN